MNEKYRKRSVYYKGKSLWCYWTAINEFEYSACFVFEEYHKQNQRKSFIMERKVNLMD